MRFLEQYRELHRKKKFLSFSVMQFVPEIAELVVEFQSKRILDYGCGSGKQYEQEKVHKIWGVKYPAMYDPAVPGHDRLPTGKFDGVICTDVLEHIPEDELNQVLRQIAGFTRQWAFLTVCCRQAKKLLPDGRNVHVTIQPFEWWQARVKPYFPDDVRVILRETK